MIYDSEAQKAFIVECVMNFPTTYGKAIQLSNSFGKAIQDGTVFSRDEQLDLLMIKDTKTTKEEDGGGS